jgi:hypothetical protein
MGADAGKASKFVGKQFEEITLEDVYCESSIGMISPYH